jgi:hypothetical protein
VDDTPDWHNPEKRHHEHESNSITIEEARKIVQSRKKSAVFWTIFNIVLFTGGVVSFVVVEFPLLLIGVVLFCPYSIAKNLWKLHKAQKLFKELV